MNDFVAAGLEEGYEDVSPGIGKWLRKRKRSVSSVHSSGGGKKARHGDFLAEGVEEEIPDSQAAAVVDEVEMQTAEELYQNDISLISNEGQSPVEQPPASQELPWTVDERVEDHLTESEVEFSLTEEHNEDDVTGDTDDEEAVHSQLAREEEQASADRESRLASRPASPAQHGLAPNMSLLEQQPVENTDEERPQHAMMAGQEPQRVEPGPKPSEFEGLMALFRSGLETLRSLNLTREQYYEAEDMLFEVKREMLEAERRGGK